MKALYFILFLLISQNSFSQVIKDLDKDGVKDSVWFDQNKDEIVYKLSTEKFIAISCPVESYDEINAGVRETKSGFEFFVAHMRAGSASQYRYEKKDKKIRLIGMSRYEFGPANNNGSGESSVNLLTNNYIGEWNYYDLDKEELIKMPAIKTKMYFPKIYLQNDNEYYMNEYETKCSALYYKYKKKLYK